MNIDDLIQAIEAEPAKISDLKKWLSHGDEAMRWQAVEAAEYVSPIVHANDPAALRALCQSLLDAPFEANAPHLQALGAIISSVGAELLEFSTPLLERVKANPGKEETVAALWALATIGPVSESFQSAIRQEIHPLITSDDPDIAGIALQAMKQFGGLSMSCCPGKDCC